MIDGRRGALQLAEQRRADVAGRHDERLPFEEVGADQAVEQTPNRRERHERDDVQHEGATADGRYGAEVEDQQLRQPREDVPAQQLFQLVPARVRAARVVALEQGAGQEEHRGMNESAEGGIDTAHFSFLHMPVTSSEAESDAVMSRSSADRNRTRWMREDGMPRFQVEPFDAGLVIGAARRADGDDLYWRVSHFLLPNHGLAPNAFAGENYHGQTWVPIDDGSCWVYCYTWNPERPLTDVERRRLAAGQSVHSEVDERFVPIRNRENDYLIDRADQKLRTFTGIRGISEQDAAIQNSQGVIADRAREHLGPTDLAIVRFRRLMLEGARNLGAGLEPAAAKDGAAYTVRSGSALADRAIPFADVMTARFGDPLGRVGRGALDAAARP